MDITWDFYRKVACLKISDMELLSGGGQDGSGDNDDSLSLIISTCKGKREQNP